MAKQPQKKKVKKKLRGVNELFQNGEIFEAKNKELDAALKELSMNPVPNPTTRHRDIIRAITILTIGNNRYTSKVQIFNIMLTIIIIALTVQSFRLMTKQTELMIKQTEYTEVSTRSERINQAKAIKQAVEHCEINPDSDYSGLDNTVNGNPATCDLVLKKYKK